MGNSNIVKVINNLSELTGDTGITSPTNLQILQYITASKKWINKSLSDAGIAAKEHAGKPSATLVIATATSQGRSYADYTCDGTADDVQINAAITALALTGGKIILLEGTYNIADAITINAANITIEGMGWETKITSNAGSPLTYGILITAAHATLRNLWLDGGSTSINYGIKVKETSHCRIEGCKIGNVRIDGCTIGNDATDCIIINNYFVDCTDPTALYPLEYASGFEVEDGSQRILFANNIIENCYCGAYIHTHTASKNPNDTVCKDVSVIGNIFRRTGSYATGLQFQMSLVGATIMDGMLARGNLFQGAGLRCTEASGCQLDVIIDGNRFTSHVVADSFEHCLYATGLTMRLTITNNQIYGSGAKGIYISYSPVLIIKGNTIEYCQSDGIRIAAGCDYAIIEGNIIRNNGQADAPATWYYGIDCYASHVLIANNKIYDTTSKQDLGIRLRDNDCVLANNELYGNVAKDLQIDADATNTRLIGNVIAGTITDNGGNTSTISQDNGVNTLSAAIISSLTASKIVVSDANKKLISGSHAEADFALLTDLAAYALTSQKLDDFGTPDDNTDLDASSSRHGLVPKAVAPIAGQINVVAIGNGETIYENKNLLYTEPPQNLGTANQGSATTASRGDHIHQMPKLDGVIAPDDGTTLDATPSLHGLMSKADKAKLDKFLNEKQYVHWFEDFDAGNAQMPHFTISTSGTAAGSSSANSANNEYGWRVFSTTTTDGYVLLRGLITAVLFGGGTWTIEWKHQIVDLSDGTDNIGIAMGFIDALTIDQTDGAYFGLEYGVNSNKWQIVTASNSSRTAQDSGITADTNAHTYKIVVNAAANLVTFYIDGVAVGTSNDNIPKAATRVTGMGFLQYKTASGGTPAARTSKMEWWQTDIEFTAART